MIFNIYVSCWTSFWKQYLASSNLQTHIEAVVLAHGRFCAG